MTIRTIYLLDDEEDQIDLLKDIVELAGLNAICYHDAEQFCLEQTRFEHEDILLLDLNMPGMDGIEVMRRIATLDCAPSLILVSGHDSGVLHSAEKLGRAHKLNILASLSKPIDIDALQTLITGQSQNAFAQTVFKPNKSKAPLSEAELRKAISENQLLLHYQPKFQARDESLVSAEALVRWQHPEQGLLFPDKFIPLAEDSGLIGELTHWVINKAVEQEQNWQAQGLNIGIAVNISAIDITSLTLPEQLATLLKEKRLDPTRIVLEITESALMGELVTSLDILTRMRLKGFGLSIDDFGTGYSSLSQLHRVPFSELKIDRSFVSNITGDEEARAIVKTCILLGHELKMNVVAEGVEKASDLKILQELGCDLVQGYYFSKPLPAEEFNQRYHQK